MLLSRIHVLVCVRACVRACVRVCVCVCAYARACVTIAQHEGHHVSVLSVSPLNTESFVFSENNHQSSR